MSEPDRVRDCQELRVFQAALDAAMRLFELSRSFPAEERYSLTDQVRRSSRSVCANIGEAWRKRRYPPHFASKLSDAESEAEETRVWITVAERCGYLSPGEANRLREEYDHVIAQLVKMAAAPEKWKV